MFQIKWTKKALLSLAETLEYWNIHNYLRLIQKS